MAVTFPNKEAIPGLTRYAASVSYDGSVYHGWQRLKTGHPTIQQHVEDALGTVANHNVEVVCAGRTDAGVHATRQIIHFDSDAKRQERSWVFGANRYLPDDISINWVKPVANTFHARFSAVARRYIYIIYNHVIKPAHLNKKMTWNHKPLNAGWMQEAGNYLVGEHDFNAYRTVHCQAKHAVRNIMYLKVKRSGHLVIIDIQANAFLHHMVRNIAGVLMAIGCGERKVTWTKEVLKSRDRRCGGITAPPYGLYFADVLYPYLFRLPDEAIDPPFIACSFSSPTELQ